MTGLSALRRIPLPALVGVLFTAAVTWLALSDPPEQGPDPAPRPAASKAVPGQTPAQKAPPAAPAQIAGQSAVPLPRQLRNVSPDGVRTPVVSAPIVRVAPSPIYLERLNPPVDPLPDGPIELHQPEVVDGGTLTTKAFTVRLARIKALGLNETCVSRVGGTWPCGVLARTALRGLVRMNRVSCEKVTEVGPRTISADCMRGSVDLAAWMVQNGWAIPDPSAPEDFNDLMQQAKERKAGQWQSQWLAELPQTAAPLQSLDETLLPLSPEEGGLRAGLEEGAAPLRQQEPDLLNPLGLPQEQDALGTP